VEQKGELRKGPGRHDEHLAKASSYNPQLEASHFDRDSIADCWIAPDRESRSLIGSTKSDVRTGDWAPERHLSGGSRSASFAKEANERPNERQDRIKCRHLRGRRVSSGTRITPPRHLSGQENVTRGFAGAEK
jgi:hypothetical protein